LNAIKRIIASLPVIIAAALLFPLFAIADTDGSEMQITDQPERLILQLGPQWAGVEFELKTDAGVFPIPVTVDASGILQMDLGGSKTYTLSCLSSPVSIPMPHPDPEAQAPPPEETAEAGQESNAEPDATGSAGIPVLQLVVFLVGLLGAGGGLLVMRHLKKRRESYGYDDDYDDDYE
jgi:hypothetical protein